MLTTGTGVTLFAYLCSRLSRDMLIMLFSLLLSMLAGTLAFFIDTNHALSLRQVRNACETRNLSGDIIVTAAPGSLNAFQASYSHRIPVFHNRFIYLDYGVRPLGPLGPLVDFPIFASWFCNLQLYQWLYGRHTGGFTACEFIILTECVWNMPAIDFYLQRKI